LLREGGAGAGALEHLLGFALQCRDLIRRCVFRHRHQNFGQIERCRGCARLAFLVAQILVNLEFAHGDARIDLALAKTVD
jgi:hypothetical protein